MNESVIARLHEANVAVFDLGDTRGFVSLLGDIDALGQVLNLNTRAAQLTGRIERELKALERAVPVEKRPVGMYLSMYGDSFFGGTTNTSFADMLAYGGIDDLAPKHGYKEWPQDYCRSSCQWPQALKRLRLTPAILLCRPHSHKFLSLMF